MPSPSLSKKAIVLLSAFAAFIALLVGSTAQTPQTAPTALASPTPAESPSPSPSPTPEPSPTPLPAPLNFHRWGSITLFNGLPSDSVRAIAQTPDGVMWFGTENGLARFDGRRIQKYSLGSVDADRILVLRVDPNGSLWIGTAAGAFEYGEDGYRSVQGTGKTRITALLVDNEVLLGTGDGTVLRVERAESLTVSRLLRDPITDAEGRPLAIAALARNGSRLLASTSGRGVFVIENEAAAEYPSSPRPLFVNSLSSDAGRLRFGADAAAGQSGMYEVGNESTERIAAETGNVLTLSSIDGDLWAGTEKNGLFHFPASGEAKNFTFANTSGGLRSDFIFTLFTDREGVLWIGTNRGVSRFDRRGPMQETVSESPNGNFIRTLFRTGDGTLYAGSNRGLFVKGDEMWRSVAGHERSTVFALTEDRAGRLIVGTSERTTDTRSFAEFKNERYAAIYGLGIARVTPRGNAVVYAGPTVNALAATPDLLWIGTTSDGILKFDGKTVQHHITSAEMDSGAIWRLLPMPSGDLWVAAEKGVFRVVDKRAEKIVEAVDVRDVYVSGQDVWAATTTRGLIHARLDDQFGWLTSSLGFEQGLPSEKAFSILPSDDGLLIASNRGIVTYRPGKVTPKLIATRVLSQRVHDIREIRSKIELEYPQNSLVIEVAGQSSRTSPQEFQYGFLLKNEKSEIVDKRVSYDPQYAPADLKPGTYSVEVVAFDRDLLASEPLTIAFSIARAPFPWTATALGVLLAIALIALVWAVVERRRIAQRNRELKQARFDLANEAERERGRIARDLHDQTLADLRNLMLKSDKLGVADPTFREEIESVSKEVRRICEDLSPSVLENVGLIAALEFLLSHSVENYRFDSTAASDEAIAFPTSVQLQIYRIAQEALSNIQKHSDASIVAMRIATPSDGSFEMTISDDGKPFTPSEEIKLDGRGIGGIRSRASLIDAEVEWQSRTDSNKFRLSLIPHESRHIASK
jgi:signal transduction histidine kinase/ligand-binding sensor domain-containing protein